MDSPATFSPSVRKLNQSLNNPFSPFSNTTQIKKEIPLKLINPPQITNVKVISPKPREKNKHVSLSKLHTSPLALLHILFILFFFFTLLPGESYIRRLLDTARRYEALCYLLQDANTKENKKRNEKKRKTKNPERPQQQQRWEMERL